MPECRYAKLLQVLGGQARQDRFVNLVLTEDLLVLSEAKAPQPNYNVHDDAPAGRNGYASPVRLTLQREIILQQRRALAEF